MSGMAKTNRTLLELCVAGALEERGGSASNLRDVLSAVPAGTRGCEAIFLWAIAAAASDEFPGVNEYAAWWDVTDRQARRDRQSARDCFGDAWPEVVKAVAKRLPAERIERRADAIRLGPNLRVPSLA